MKQLLLIIPLFALSACATLTAESDEEIHVVTTPTGAHCDLANKSGRWTITKTPGSAKVDRSFSPLTIHCSKDTLVGDTSLEPSTRGRSYWKILLLGVTAFVDAGTGAGYEYAQDKVEITLSPATK